MVQVLLVVLVAVLAGGLLYGMAAARVVKQYERGVVLRLGRLHDAVRPPGFTMIVPGIDRLRKVNMQIVTMPVPAQDGITRDNVTVRVDAVIYFKVVDPASAVIQVEDYRFAVSQMAQTSLRSIIGKSDLDDLLSDREKLNQGLELMIDSPAVGWGVQIDRVEIKDVSLPETMKRSMARQAEADRERRARVINADAELQASKKLAQAAQQMSTQPAALQLRLLQTVVAVAAEKNSTLVLPFPVELLRFLERAQQGQQPQSVSDGQRAPEQQLPEPDAAEPDAAVPGVVDPGLADPAVAAPSDEAVDRSAVDPTVALQTFTDQPLPDGSLTDGTPEPDGVPESGPEALPEFEPEQPPEHARRGRFTRHH
ncbi:Regulator of protease activity HflC, stomatin/prohibitin superfamily [Streptomyces sp. LamerLS-316]|uniref:SPFH domain-containing protein n=1 Tax=unclassified Streptomyces TaxID=2593676 RepID=UPI000823B53A|nr:MULTISPECIES: SPFH domain-containing protein [unclassified Streptomyces]MYQ38003.1 slipin family protein [Streptomyces sp. SID4921]SCK48274.1 Regulator of protease activity HflC, stomatin/prohibitin superfamily [Streptomyces sp. LamerLS-316]